MPEVYVIYEFGGQYEDSWQKSRFVVKTEEEAISKVEELNRELKITQESERLLKDKCLYCPLAEYTLEREMIFNENLNIEDVSESTCKELITDYCNEFKYLEDTDGEINCELHFVRAYNSDDLWDSCGYRYEKAELI